MKSVRGEEKEQFDFDAFYNDELEFIEKLEITREDQEELNRRESFDEDYGDYDASYEALELAIDLDMSEDESFNVDYSCCEDYFIEIIVDIDEILKS